MEDHHDNHEYDKVRVSYNFSCIACILVAYYQGKEFRLYSVYLGILVFIFDFSFCLRVVLGLSATWMGLVCNIVLFDLGFDGIRSGPITDFVGLVEEPLDF